MNENFRFLTLKMDSLAKKNDRTRHLFFSSGGIRFVFWPPNREGKSKKDAWFKDNHQQLMNLENMNTFAQVYNLQVIAGLGVGYIWKNWIKILGHDLLITIFLIFLLSLKKTGIWKILVWNKSGTIWRIYLYILGIKGPQIVIVYLPLNTEYHLWCCCKWAFHTENTQILW